LEGFEDKGPRRSGPRGDALNGTGDHQRLRILHLEDNAADAALVEALLRSARFDLEVERVMTREQFEEALRQATFDLILSDYSLPGFDGQSALELARSLRPDVPFLFVSGTIGEDRAVESLKGGAVDFVLKDNFGRLAPAVRRALDESRERSARRRAEDALRTSEERYALAARGANDGLWDWDLRAGKVYLSPRWKSMLGWGVDEVSENPQEWFGRVHPQDLPGLKARLAAHLDGHSEHFESEYRIAHRDGSWLWMLSRGLGVHSADGTPLRMAGSQTDVTHRKKAEEQLLHDALHDALTGLPNRASFLDRLQLVMNQAWGRAERRFAVLFLDLDRFKVVNDSLGHVIGDRLLVEIARRLEASLRQGDTVARLGGDEFALLLDSVGDATDATRAAERIHRELEPPFHLEGHEVFSSASIGIALSTTAYEKPEDMLRDADTAMYRAKAVGRAGHAVFDQAMHARAMAVLRLETDLRRAVEKDELRLHYQPVISLADGRLASLESLVRWNHPQKGLVMPGEFIELAEETGLIVPLGGWVLREACRQMGEWSATGQGAPFLSVNLSPRQFAHTDVVGDVRSILESTGLPGSRLGLEITESALMEGGDVRARLVELRHLGVRLLLDDFGTGYSSLSYLLRFPIDIIKIDASFVRGLPDDPEKAAIVRSILTIGHNLRMQVIAEGVEEEAEVEMLRSLGCDYGQGFHWSRALPADAVSGLFSGKHAESH
jgi:diguanylate cyclase (GGDEF)-like protein/PAS domain S-box-containing protein